MINHDDVARENIKERIPIGRKFPIIQREY